MNLTDEVSRGRLTKAIEGSYRAIEPFRNVLHGLVDEYAGDGYGQSRSRPKHETLINLMNQAADAYQMALVANRPRVMVTARYPEYSYFAKQFQLAANNLIEEIRLEETLKRWVLDALFCVGIVKTHMADSAPVMLEEGFWMDPGTPFVSNVSLDNWVHDAGATTWHEVRFAGDTYRLAFDDLKGSMFDQAEVAKLVPNSKTLARDDERLESFSTGHEVDPDELEPMIDLADIWIPRDRKIYTFALDSRHLFRIKGKPIAVMDDRIPEGGPYDLLGFNEVPENIMPTSPFSQISNLARLANNLIRKQKRQAQRQKDNPIYSPSGADDAKRLQNAADGEWIKVNDPKEVGLLKQGGVDAGNQAFFIGVVDMFDRMAGNLPAMMGLGAQAETASQEQLIHSAVSKKEGNMQARVWAGVRSVIRKSAFMLWHDQYKVMPGRLPVPGADGYSVDATWTPEDREGNYLDYNTDIDVYSLAYQTPAQRLNAINKILGEVYAPMFPMLQQQGGIIDMQALVEKHAELMNEPWMRDLVKFTAMPQEQQPRPQEGPGKPAVTSRNYTRRSVPTGGTLASRNHVAQQSWLQGAVNQGQQASLNRPPAR